MSSQQQKSWKKCLPAPSVTEKLNPSREALRLMEEENRRFPVDRLVDIPRSEWPAGYHNMLRAARCRDFLVQVYNEPNDIVRLSIQRCAFDCALGRWKDGITWDDLQHLKALAGFGDCCAVEVYPPDEAVVNVANIRHLWVLPEPPAFMWGAQS